MRQIVNQPTIVHIYCEEDNGGPVNRISGCSAPPPPPRGPISGRYIFRGTHGATNDKLGPLSPFLFPLLLVFIINPLETSRLVTGPDTSLYQGLTKKIMTQKRLTPTISTVKDQRRLHGCTENASWGAVGCVRALILRRHVARNSG